MPRHAALPPTLSPRLISREAAAAYIGVGVTKLDELVRDGRMPKPRRIDKRKVWDVRQLDSAVDDLLLEGAAIDGEWDVV